jgi:hypothetical protein
VDGGASLVVLAGFIGLGFHKKQKPGPGDSIRIAIS